MSGVRLRSAKARRLVKARKAAKKVAKKITTPAVRPKPNDDALTLMMLHSLGGERA